MSKKDVIDIIAFYPKISGEIAFYERMKSNIEEKYGVRGVSVAETPPDGAVGDPTGRNAERMAESGDGDHLREIEAEVERLQRLRSQIFGALKLLPYYEKQVVWYYYIDGKRWAWIARAVGYSVMQCQRLRDSAIEGLAKSFNENSVKR